MHPIANISLRVYCMPRSLLSEARAVREDELWRTWIWSVFFLLLYPPAQPCVPPRVRMERMNKGRKERAVLIIYLKATLHPLHLWDDSNPIISESPAHNVAPGWNRNSKNTYYLMNQ